MVFHLPSAIRWLHKTRRYCPNRKSSYIPPGQWVIWDAGWASRIRAVGLRCAIFTERGVSGVPVDASYLLELFKIGISGSGERLWMANGPPPGGLDVVL